MKKLNILVASLIITYALSISCERNIGDFLDKPPGVDVTEDTIFSSKTQMETFLTSIYSYGIHSYLGYGSEAEAPNNNPEETLMACATDEAEACASWYAPQRWNAGTINADSRDDEREGKRWIAIRKISVFLDRVDGVPGLEPAYLEQVKGEAKFIRALNYFEMLIRYGGIPIIDKRLELNDNFLIPRSTVEEVVNFILKDCNEATAVLPVSYPVNLRGRITKLAAMTLKAKTLLYAASPQFNTATPYLDFGENNKLICLGSYDVNRWQLAADAAKEVLSHADEAGVSLIIDKGFDKNYKYQWEVYDNKEIILAEKGAGLKYFREWPWNAISPPSVYNGWSGQSGITPTLNFVKHYERRDGSPQTWDPVGGSDLQAKMLELDYRFHQTVAYNMSYWNWQFPIIQIYQGGRDAKTCYGGFWLHKLYPEAINNTTTTTYIPNSTLFALNEVYLNYAEALNEAKGPTQQAYDAVNEIRRRSGMPDLPTGLSQEEFRKRIRNERAVELAFDGMRFWDIRRWLIAENEGVMNGKMYGIKIYPITGKTEYRYETYVFENRTWLPRMYLHPFGRNEVNKGYIIQNPGY